MGESTEDLEPLFDYSRVQPSDFVYLDDDDFESSPIVTGGKRKGVSDPADVKGKGIQNAVIALDGDDDDGKEKEEEDWMPPPPPKIPNSGSGFQEDKTIQELRLKKQELASFAQSAAEVLKAVIESSKKGFSYSTQPKVDQPQTQVERQKIVISIQDESGQKQFRMYMDDKFERLFKMYAERAQHGMDNLVFCFDGDKVSPDATPERLGLENDDMLEVRLKSH